jgi:hypothetical protein
MAVVMTVNGILNVDGAASAPHAAIQRARPIVV